MPAPPSPHEVPPALPGARIAAQYWFLPAVLGLTWLAAALLPDSFASWRYDRTALAGGEWWRLLTAHFAHLNLTHLALNLLGLWLIAEFLRHPMPVARMGAAMACSIACIDLALWQLHPDVQWYAGGSGVLHGLWAASALQCWLGGFSDTATRGKGSLAGLCHPSFSRIAGAAAAFLLLVKLAAEAWIGPSTTTQAWIGSPVIDAAHRFGALGGALGWLLAWFLARLRAGSHGLRPAR